MAEAGVPATSDPWPAEGLLIDEALKRLDQRAWSHYAKARVAARDVFELLSRNARLGFKPLRSLDAAQERRHRRFEAWKAALDARVHKHGQGEFELVARFDTPLAEPRPVPAAAIPYVTGIDYEKRTAECQGSRLFDLRLRRRTLPVTEESARETAEPAVAAEPASEAGQPAPEAAPVGKEEPVRPAAARRGPQMQRVLAAVKEIYPPHGVTEDSTEIVRGRVADRLAAETKARRLADPSWDTVNRALGRRK